MRVPYGEGVASHTGPESCGDDREVVVEALTAGGEPVEPGNVRAGYRASKTLVSGVPTPSCQAEGNSGRSARARIGRTPRGQRPRARTETPHSGGGASRAKDCSFMTEAGRSRGRLGWSSESAP